MRRAASLIHTSEIKKATQFTYRGIININDIHLYEDTGHVSAIFRKSPRETHMFLQRPGAHGHNVGDPWSKG